MSRISTQISLTVNREFEAGSNRHERQRNWLPAINVHDPKFFGNRSGDEGLSGPLQQLWVAGQSGDYSSNELRAFAASTILS